MVKKIKAGDARLSRPWVLFLHGNNQTTAKNIAKAVDIEKQHDVNVIAFSWPSQPYTGKQDPVLNAIKKEAVKHMIKALGGTNIVNMVLSKAAGKAEEFLRNYLQARMNAEKSPPDFSHALKVISDLLLKQTGKKVKLSFMCHSLGNYLLQNTVQNGMPVPIRFKNIMLHQADVDALSHAKWVKKLYPKKDRLYITANQYDYILMASNFVNRKERLGQTKHHYGVNNCTYIDLSDAAYTSAENEHEFFRLSDRAKGFSYTNDEIHALMGKVCRSERPAFSRTAGFTKKEDNCYHLVEYIDPIDDEIRNR